MDDIQNEMLGLLSACKTCKTPCCNDKYFLSLPGERDAIVAAGHPDHFTKVVTKMGTHFVLDFREDDCPYLGPQGCSIPNEKPTTCRAYPAAFDYKKRVLAHPSCKSHELVTESYLKNAEPLLEKYCAAYSDDTHNHIMRGFKLLPQRVSKYD